jgi:hypothetical protein
VEVLGAHTEAGAAQRLLGMCCKAVVGAKGNWQVSTQKGSIREEEHKTIQSTSEF